MKRRILAWVMLVGFVVLLVNIIVFRYMWELSIALYVVILLYYCFTMMQRKKQD